MVEVQDASKQKSEFVVLTVWVMITCVIGNVI